MAHISDSALQEMSQAEIIQQMMSLLTVLGKKEKATSKFVEKAESKKEKCAPPKGVRPVQLDKSTAWVEFVHMHILTNGWESFTHSEKFGKGMADFQYPESEMTAVLDDDGKEQLDEDGDVVYAHVIKGSVKPSSPNGDQPNMSHAMSISKMYWSPTKKSGSKPDLYQEFLDQYVAPPAPEGAGSKPVKKVVSRVALTLEEKMEAKREREEEKEAEKQRKKEEREEKKRERDAEKEAEKQRKEAEKAAKLAMKVPKGAAKAIKPPVSVKGIVPVAKPAPSSASKPTVAATKKPVVKEDWVPPTAGKCKPFTLRGVTYLRDADNVMTTVTTGDEDAEVVGIYDPITQTISEDIPEEIMAKLKSQ